MYSPAIHVEIASLKNKKQEENFELLFLLSVVIVNILFGLFQSESFFHFVYVVQFLPCKEFHFHVFVAFVS